MLTERPTEICRESGFGGLVDEPADTVVRTSSHAMDIRGAVRYPRTLRWHGPVAMVGHAIGAC